MGRRKASADSKKRKLAAVNDHVDHEVSDCGELVNNQSEKLLRSLLFPLGKDQLVDLLVKLGVQIPEAAEEIRGVASNDSVHRKLFVRGLAWETTSETLCGVFSAYGEIEEGAVIIDKTTGKSRGYGFITFKRMESSQKALEQPCKLIDGRQAVCNLACEGLSSASAMNSDVASRKMYIGGLSPDVSTEMLLNFFGKYGGIEEGSVAFSKDTNKSRGFGFVTYKTVGSANKAIADPNKILGGRSIIVKPAGTQPKGGMMQPHMPIPDAYSQFSSSPGGGLSSAPVATCAPLYIYDGHYYSNAPPLHYAAQSHAMYPLAGRKREAYGMRSASPTGVSSYPYYLTS